MRALRQVALILSRWIDDVASAILSIVAAFQPKRELRLAEQDDSAFAVEASKRRSTRARVCAKLKFVDGGFVEAGGGQGHLRLAGAQIELVLARRRFVFRTLELPQQASGFLDAIVRSQIDRLTPWTAAQAAFGCSPAKEASNGRIGVVVAATARSALMPFVTALEAFKPNSIVISAAAEDDDSRTIVFSRDINREWSLPNVRRVVVATPAAAGIAVIVAFAALAFVSADVENSGLQISQQMAERRAALVSAGAGVAEQATAKLAQQKRETPAAVIVLEQLSQVLPDDTYLTELHVADGKLEISGVTREAASLIRIIEQTEQFKNATFFAPTTRAAGENDEQFHIAAKIVPFFPVFR